MRDVMWDVILAIVIGGRRVSAAESMQHATAGSHFSADLNAPDTSLMQSMGLRGEWSRWVAPTESIQSELRGSRCGLVSF